jgi:hypothetical protein
VLSTGPNWGGYTVDEAAATARRERRGGDDRPGRGLCVFRSRQPTRYREEWLPGIAEQLGDHARAVYLVEDEESSDDLTAGLRPYGDHVVREVPAGAV